MASTATGQYSNTLTPNDGCVFVRSGPSLGGFDFGGGGDVSGDPSEPGEAKMNLQCTVAMGGENVTAASFDISTGEILIEEVTGDIVVKVETMEV